ncbi:putative P-loop containing nucleoside triphosphate hydrolase, leucine-rich repeat domain superfamily [Helianthus debilis subsp. tardiflorus]
MIGIKGMGGGGKTTLARAVFDYISVWFEGKSFVENVREVSKGSLYGMKELQKQVLSAVLNDQSINVTSVSDGKNMMKKMMCGRKVLVVLDDVDDIGQLEALAGEPTWFYPGSRIIITTRDEQVLKAHQVKYIHNVSLLLDEEAVCLFSRYAFGGEIPNQGYEELSRMVVHYAAGLPLTIKVLGSFLYGRTGHEWVDTIERLKTIPLEKTMIRLELSYNGLENDQKEIFLDVVCILKGERKDKAIRILESCGFNAQIGLRVLEERSLIIISDTYQLRFHDHIEEMGMNIARPMHPDELSRLLELDSFMTVFYTPQLQFHDHIEEMGWNIVRRTYPDKPSNHSRLWIKEEIEDILVNESGTEATRCIKLKNTNLSPTIIMKGLRSMRELRFLYVGKVHRKWKVDDASQYLPDALRSLYWHGYPFSCLPKTFQANKLVNFEMVGSNISELWEGGERKVLNKIRFLDLTRSKLRTFDLRMTPHLETLDLGGCNDFVELLMPVKCPKLKFLNLSGSKVRNLNLGLTAHLEMLYLEGCHDFVELLMPVECPKLKFLYLSGCKVSNINLALTPHLERLDLTGCHDFVELLMPVECPKLEYLYLSGCKVSNINLALTPHLERLDLTGCHDFVELLMPVECLKLKFLYLSGCKVSDINLALTPHLERLNLKECYCLQEIHAPLGCLKDLVYMNLSGCSRFEYFLFDKQSQMIGHDSMATLMLTARSLDICPLHPNNNLPKLQFRCFYDEPLSSWSGNVEKLLSFGFCACTNLESFSASICGLQNLGELTFKGSIPEAPKDLSQLDTLEKLTLSMDEIKHLPDGICMLKHLKYLNLGCWHLEHLPHNICMLACLEELHLSGCESLQDIPNSIGKMTHLKHLHLSNCIRVEKLPEELGCLECLEVLRIDGAGISHLPQSIYELKGLCIIGSRAQLQSYGFTSLEEFPSERPSYYIQL